VFQQCHINLIAVTQLDMQMLFHCELGFPPVRTS